MNVSGSHMYLQGDGKKKQRDRLYNADMTEWRKMVSRDPMGCYRVPVYYQERGYIIDHVIGYANVSYTVLEKVLEGRLFSSFMKNNKALFEGKTGELHLFYVTKELTVKWLVKEIIQYYIRDLAVNQGDVVLLNQQSFDLREENISISVQFRRDSWVIMAVIPLLAYDVSRKIQENWRDGVRSYEDVCHVTRLYTGTDDGFLRKGMERESNTISKTRSNFMLRNLDAGFYSRSFMEGDERNGELRSGQKTCFVKESNFLNMTVQEQLNFVRSRVVTRISGIYYEGSGFSCEIYTADGIFHCGVFPGMYSALCKRCSEEQRFYGGVTWSTAYHFSEFEYTMKCAYGMVEDRFRYLCQTCMGAVQLMERRSRAVPIAPMSEDLYHRFLEKRDRNRKCDLDVLVCRCMRVCFTIYEMFEIGFSYKKFRDYFFVSEVDEVGENLEEKLSESQVDECHEKEKEERSELEDEEESREDEKEEETIEEDEEEEEEHGAEVHVSEVGCGENIMEEEDLVEWWENKLGKDPPSDWDFFVGGE